MCFEAEDLEVAGAEEVRQGAPNLELAALGLGARPWRTFRRVTLPLIMPGVVTGAIFAFITSWDEVVIAIFMTTTSLRTIPVLVWADR